VHDPFVSLSLLICLACYCRLPPSALHNLRTSDQVSFHYLSIFYQFASIAPRSFILVDRLSVYTLSKCSPRLFWLLLFPSPLRSVLRLRLQFLLPARCVYTISSQPFIFTHFPNLGSQCEDCNGDSHRHSRIVHLVFDVELRVEWQ
jgi:hypothetical protein